MENEFIGLNFRDVLECEKWIVRTTTLSELSRLHDEYVDYAGSHHTGVNDEKYYEDALRARVIKFYQQHEGPEPPNSRDLRDWQVWFVKATDTGREQKAKDNLVERKRQLEPYGRMDGEQLLEVYCDSAELQGEFPLFYDFIFSIRKHYKDSPLQQDEVWESLLKIRDGTVETMICQRRLLKKQGTGQKIEPQEEDGQAEPLKEPAKAKPDSNRVKCWRILKKITGWLFKKTFYLIGAIIVTIIGGLIVAVLIDIFGDFGWLERIKAVIYNILP